MRVGFWSVFGLLALTTDAAVPQEPTITLTDDLKMGKLSLEIPKAAGEGLEIGEKAPSHVIVGPRAQKLFSEDEVLQIKNLPVASDRPEHFRKEAFYKAEVSEITKDLKEELMYRGYIAGAAYCKAKGMVVSRYFHNIDTQVAGFIGVNEDRKEIYVSFRGSHTFVNWLYNLYAIMTTIPWRRTCMGLRQPKVHEGFLLDYESVSNQIVPHVSSLLSKYPTFTVQVVGHSLGGALATLCALDLNEAFEFKQRIQLSTYGAPRVGDDDFARLVEKHFPFHLDRLRVTNGNDVIPHLPPYLGDNEYFGYHHAPQEIFILPGAKTDSLAYACDPMAGEDPRCANAYLGYSVEDHCYFPWGLHFCAPCEE